MLYLAILCAALIIFLSETARAIFFALVVITFGLLVRGLPFLLALLLLRACF